MPRIFISYSNRNLRRAKRLALALKNRGLDVWFDKWDLLVGHNLFDSIYDGIRKSDFLAVILTKQSVKSKWVKEELDSAKMDELEKGGTKILPLLFQKCEIPHSLRAKKYANFLNFNKGMEELIQTLLPDSRKSIVLENPTIKNRDGEAKRIRIINSIIMGEPRLYDDLFLGCISFEDRSTWCLRNYPEKTIGNIILFNVGEFSRTSKLDSQIRNKEYLLNETNSVLKDKGSCNIFNWKNFDNLNETLSISRQLKKIIGNNRECSVSVDISSFPQPYFLQLLRILDDLTHDIRIFYVSPDRYYPGGYSIGVKKVQSLHYGAFAPNKEILLIAFLGFLIERVDSIEKPRKAINRISLAFQLNQPFQLRTLLDHIRLLLCYQHWILGTIV